RRRLEVEAWRDAVLAVTGTLQDTLGGPSLALDRPDNLRRTVYAGVKRRELPDLLRLNDFPDPTTHSPGRMATTTPLQSLFVLNSEFMRRQAMTLAARLRSLPGDDAARVRQGYRWLFARPATDTEVRLGLDYLAAAGADWSEYAQVLLGSNEFLYVD
ncbi:MAG: DUF1553 domain-containing protein, partial [Planctomycetia bacterium]|nr:DUF1553 domain-containing protein [Planctomycetia bacterium]